MEKIKGLTREENSVTIHSAKRKKNGVTGFPLLILCNKKTDMIYIDIYLFGFWVTQVVYL